MDREFLTATDAAKYLSIGKTTFYRWCEVYNIKFYLVGGIKRYSKKDLRAFMEENDATKKARC